jgi:nucleoside-diphosphate-sugar epimerase
MPAKRIFITGASGCIGHYIADLLIQRTSHELFFMVRDMSKLKFDYNARPGITVIPGDMRDIEQLGRLLKTMNVAILAATAWGGEDVFDINVVKTLRLLNLLDPAICEQVIYFSTASILDRHNQPLREAGELGTDYIRSKYTCHLHLSKLTIAPKITTLFPTLVFGGEDNKPYSHLSSGLKEVLKWIDLIRFLQTDASFHFLHAHDIAQVVTYFVDHPPQDNEPREFVLGNPVLTVNQAVKEICTYLNKRIYFRIPLSPQLAELLIVVFRIQVAPWDRFCMSYRHFSYQNTISPESFGLITYYPTLRDLLKTSGVSPYPS